MFDIKPVKRTAGFDLNHEKQEEVSLVDFLIQEEEKVLKKYQEKNQRKKQEKDRLKYEIRKEVQSFRSVGLDQYFPEEDLPTKIILKNRGKVGVPIEEVNYKNSITWNLKKIEEKKAEALKLKKRLESKIENKQQLTVELEKVRKAQELNRIEIKKNVNYFNEVEKRVEFIKSQIQFKKQKKEQLQKTEREINREEKLNQIRKNLLPKPFGNKAEFNFFKSFLSFSGASMVIFLLIFSARFFSYGFQVKDEVMVKGVNVVNDLEKIKSNFQDKDFSQLISDFEKIQKNINQINKNLKVVEGGLPSFVSKLPFVSKYNSAKNLLEAGEEITKAMVLVSELGDEFSALENPLNLENSGDKEVSLGEFFLNLEDQTKEIENHFQIAENKIKEVDPEDLPADYQENIRKLKEKFPQILGFLTDFNQKQAIFKDLLGYNGPRKYLFLFQNNHEIRATGGFIGSYGILSVHDGNIDDLFIDGIFNPDGQLYTKMVPPKPIQKISTTWSTHDANWFPNFPDSAQKVAWFYEKTGGPTVDGILTITPTVLEKFLEFTGPINMSDYDLAIDSENFIEATQTEVEVNYDKEENKPKEFIADLTPEIFQKLFSPESLSDFPKLLSILSEALTEKHLLIYSDNSNIQETVSDLGWSGEVLKTPKDYLMVINSNINGYKTDGVIDQKIDHEIEIQSDGSIIDTVTIERAHNGGNLEYDWWNKVNANYMRVYVPRGSELLEASGHTLETVDSPVNYDKLGFVKDELVTKLEESTKIDQSTGTEIWQEAGKTVFGNWVYVSPQEKVKVVYKYKLPFKIQTDQSEDQLDNYSILYQKQSGMNTSTLNSEIILNDNQEVFWQYPKTVQNNKNLLKYNTNLEKDRFMGIVIK